MKILVALCVFTLLCVTKAVPTTRSDPAIVVTNLLSRVKNENQFIHLSAQQKLSRDSSHNFTIHGNRNKTSLNVTQNTHNVDYSFGIPLPLDFFSNDEKFISKGFCKNSCRIPNAKQLYSWKLLNLNYETINYKIVYNFTKTSIIKSVNVTSKNNSIVISNLNQEFSGTLNNQNDFQLINFEPECLARGQGVIHVKVSDISNSFSPIHFYVLVICGGKVSEECEKIDCGLHGSCVNGSCACDQGFFGGKCESSIFDKCPSKCSGRGISCISNKCICSAGFGGNDCSRPIGCSHLFYCSGRGQCIDNEVCSCDYGFTGISCSEPVVSDNTCKSLNYCSGNGKCIEEKNEYICSCKNGFSGIDCSTVERTCPHSCSGHGICEEGVCHCNFGYKGDYCQEAFSPCGGCLYGTCTETFGQEQPLCECDAGFTGRHCSIYDHTRDPCSKKHFCSGHGICPSDGSDDCKCNSGFSSSNCGQVIVEGCVHSCSYHGKCNTTLDTCQCDSQWSGVDCQTSRCPTINGTICSGNGVCVSGTDGQMVCECAHDYFGVSCQNMYCHSNSTCGIHGNCKKSSGVWNKLCDCKEGWSGAFCGVPDVKIVINESDEDNMALIH